MIEIQIQNSPYMATIDHQDFDLVNRHKWYIYAYKTSTLYVRTNKGLMMQHLIIPSVPEGYVRHHKDGNGLNNCRSNLIIRTNLENVQEKKIYKNNTTGYPGVKKRPTGFEAQISIMGKRKYLGIYNTFDEAVIARQAAERKYRKGEEKD